MLRSRPRTVPIAAAVVLVTANLLPTLRSNETAPVADAVSIRAINRVLLIMAVPAALADWLFRNLRKEVRTGVPRHEGVNR